MRRRELIRLLAVAGITAGCSPARDELPLGEGSRPPSETAASDAPTSGPTPGPTSGASSRPSDAPSASPTEAGSDATTTPAPQPEPEPEPTQEPIAQSADARRVEALDRQSTRLPAPQPGGTRHTITGLALHHTASGTKKASSSPERLAAITHSHQTEQGWIDIAYHWAVDLDGNIYQLRDEQLAGDTNTDYDPAGWFLVVCEGNFEERAAPQAMLEAVADVFAYAAVKYDVAPSTLRGHRELAATLCPGANLQAETDAVERMVEQRLAAGGVDLVIVHDPARGEAITNG